MADYKGVGIVFVRRIVRDANVEPQVLAALDDDERRLYESVGASSWVPIELATKLFVIAAPLVYPGSPNAIREVGRALARDNLGGVYRYIVRVLNVRILLGQAAKLWKTYHRAGEAEAVEVGPKSFDLVVRGYPGLPERFRECMAGWIVEAGVLCGEQNCRVVKEERGDLYVWHTTWR